MNRPRISRCAAVLALAVALGASNAAAQEPGTLTVSGTFWPADLQGPVGADLVAVYDNAGLNTWTLTLHGTSYAHEELVNKYGTRLYTHVHATSFDFAFEGPNADVLNAVVSQQLVGGANGVFLTLGNTTAGAGWGEWFVSLRPEDFETGISFGAEFDSDSFMPHFPSDADGYPVLGESLSLQSWATYIIDRRSGGWANLFSWYDIVDIAGDIGGPLTPTLSILDGWVLEGNKGSSKLRLAVKLSNQSDQAISVSYRTADGTALAKSDYTAASGTVTFQPGVTNIIITIPVKADRTKEPDETFTVELLNAGGTTITDGVATATIRNDD